MTVCSNYIYDMREVSSSISDFIEKAKAVHGAKYDYSLFFYKNKSAKSIIYCFIHGYFHQIPSKHLAGQGCYFCGKERMADLQRKSSDQYISECLAIHGYTYDYSKTKYTNALDYVTITCKVHGDFKQTAASHIRGFGCAKCGYELTAWNKTAYVDCSEKNKSSCVYLIKCFSEDEVFYKVGITSTKISYRFKKGKMPYKYTVLATRTDGAGADWDNEKEIHRSLKKYKYEPKIHFGGMYECFHTLDSFTLDFFGVKE